MHVAPPGQPLNLTLESVSYSWVAIQWQAPNDLRTYRLSFYNVTVYKLIPNNINSMEILIMEISTEDNETHANITGLQPGMSFRIQVAGVVILRNLSNIGLEQSCCSASLLVNTNIAGNMLIIILLFAWCTHGAQTCLFMWFTHGQVSCFAQAALFRCSCYKLL